MATATRGERVTMSSPEMHPNLWSVPKEVVLKLCFTYGRILQRDLDFAGVKDPDGISLDGPRLLWAIAGNESHWGANCKPRHEPAYDVDGLYYRQWVRRAALLIVVLIALFAVRQHYIDVGKKIGTEDTKQQVATEIAKAVKDAQTESAEKQAEHDRAFKDYMAQAQTSMQLALSLAAQRQKVATSVSGMSASEVEAAIAKALNKPTGGADTPEDRRKFASCLVQLPLCEQQVQADTETIEKGKQAIAEKQKSVDDLTADNQFLRGKFQELYNLKSTPVRSWKCLKLWRCVRPQIALPDPMSLRKP
jgi:hypothetical protein